MTRDEKYIARIILKNKILESDKQAYEDLFVRIMMNCNPNFQPIKPQGRIGDKKNDGFDKMAGKYYQVYAPENLTASEDSAITKIEEDFKGLIDYWSKNGFEIKEYFFVVNDKYKGAYPTLQVKAKELEDESKIKVDILLAKNVEDMCLTLSEEKLLEIVGFLPDGLAIQSVDYSLIGEVTKHIMEAPSSSQDELIPKSIDYQEKIKFNSLSGPFGDFLNSGHRQIYVVQDYFELNSNFVKDELRKRFSELYQLGVKSIPDGTTKNDQVFLFIRDKASPTNSIGVHNVVYVLMSYYFECCDIFETPIP